MINPVVDKGWPLEQIAEIHNFVDTRKKGKCEDHWE
jgi:hypothetical protein